MSEKCSRCGSEMVTHESNAFDKCPNCLAMSLDWTPNYAANYGPDVSPPCKNCGGSLDVLDSHDLMSLAYCKGCKKVLIFPPCS